MEALNKKERNAAIVRFALWFVLSVLIISAPIVLTAYVPGEQDKLRGKSNDSLLLEIKFERDFFAVRLQNILLAIQENADKKTTSEELNVKLLNIIEEVKGGIQGKTTWRAAMYRDAVYIAGYLIEANNKLKDAAKILEEAEKKLKEAEEMVADANKKLAERDKTIADLNKTIDKTKAKMDKIADEFEKVGNDINKLKKSCLGSNNYSDVKNTKQKLDQILSRLKQITDDL